MDNPRQEKVAVVDEVRRHFDDSDAAILTEYRGLKVKDLATLRRSVRAVGGEYKIYKNTLVRLAAKQSGLEDLEEMLVGPTGITFVTGDAAAVAKILRDYARTNPLLVVKGGVLGDKIIGAKETTALADLPSREVLLAQLAGAIAAPLQQFAGLLKALPQNLAYGLAALRDQKAAAEPAPAAESEAAVTADSGDEAASGGTTIADSADDSVSTESDEAAAEPQPSTDSGEPATDAEVEVATKSEPDPESGSTESEAPSDESTTETAPEAESPESESTESESTETAE